MENKKNTNSQKILQQLGGRVTPGRVALLSLLQCASAPLTVLDIEEKLQYKLDRVTLYRALDFLVQSQVVNKINLQDHVAYFEYNNANHHHHHIVCDKCGYIEDVENCGQEKLQKNIISKSKMFAVIDRHSLEFFGTCHNCAQ